LNRPLRPVVQFLLGSDYDIRSPYPYYFFSEWPNTHIIYTQAFSTGFSVCCTLPFTESEKPTCIRSEIGLSEFLSRSLCNSLQLQSSCRDADRALLRVLHQFCRLSAGTTVLVTVPQQLGYDRWAACSQPYLPPKSRFVTETSYWFRLLTLWPCSWVLVFGCIGFSRYKWNIAYVLKGCWNPAWARSRGGYACDRNILRNVRHGNSFAG
jgi:hypothetical protein